MNIYNILEIGESFVHYSIKTYYICILWKNKNAIFQFVDLQFKDDRGFQHHDGSISLLKRKKNYRGKTKRFVLEKKTIIRT